jgi:hypothetical protein
MSRNNTPTDSTPSKETTYDWTTFDSPVTAIIEGATELLKKEATELPQLYRYIDTDALETLLGQEGRTPIELTFTYGELTVSIDGTGRLSLKK